MSRQKKGNKKTPLYAFGKIVAQPVVRPFIPYRVKDGKMCRRIPILFSVPIILAFPIRFVSRASKSARFIFSPRRNCFRTSRLPGFCGLLAAFRWQRGRGDVGAIDHAGEVLRRGDIMGIFIEGTRSRDGELGQPKAGAVMQICL